MLEENIVVGVSICVSGLAIISCLFVIPCQYNMIQTVRSEVTTEVSAFREETDLAWIELMDVQISVMPLSLPRPDASYCPCPRRSSRFISK
ncbi:hypothetical protein L5515_008099 [Caenorhabditis briggsae]|uniref:Nematode cuticle collagen N-terminal domain-containing protein n=1 Tax=Caenorhabditis briggsae TaxID=6238 RepID=A0AAE9JL17_CAEBR|nr:hypothetical protein L5515_008099 [Caenorhabditis briggsae]